MTIELWGIFLLIAVLALAIETFVPTLFCINFAFAAIITSFISFFWGNTVQLTVIFIVLSALSLIFIKPILVKFVNKDNKVDFEGQYKGKVVKVIEAVTTTSGAVTVFEERWEARLKNGCEEIPVGCDVKIVDNDSTILYVEKV